MLHNEQIVLTLGVWVPTGAKGGWRTCSHLGPLISDEVIRTCDEIRAVVGAHSRFIAKVLSAPQAPIYRGFRLVGRAKEDGGLLGMVEWTRSHETGVFVESSEIFTACPWQHSDARLAA